MNKPAESLPTQTTLARSADKAGSTPAGTGAKRVRPATPEAVAKLLPGMLRLGANAALARAEAIAAYGRMAELAVSMGLGERVCKPERLRALSRTEIEHMTDALGKGLDVAALAAVKGA